MQKIKAFLLLIVINLNIFDVSAQITTAFSYNGRLTVDGNDANGKYDFRFSVYTSPTNGTIAGEYSVTNLPVRAGVFSTTIDFGPIFNGSNYWLSIAVSTNGANSFTNLNPLQPILPTPYSLFAGNAGSVAASNIVGTLPPTIIPSYVLTNNQVNATISGNFIGDGSGLSELNASQLTNFISITNSQSLVISAFGDSLTAGALGTNHSYPLACSLALGRVVNNFGIGGATSSQILTNLFAQTNLYGPILLCMGRNNYTDTNRVLQDLNSAVNWCNTNNGGHDYLIFPVLNGEYNNYESIGGSGYNVITNLNGIMANTYSNHYFDMREYLVIQANTNLYPSDITNLMADLPAGHFYPLLTNNVHLNGLGYDAWGYKAAILINQRIDKKYTVPLSQMGFLYSTNSPLLFANLNVAPGLGFSIAPDYNGIGVKGSLEANNISATALSVVGASANPNYINPVSAPITLGSSGSYTIAMAQNSSGPPWYFWMQVHHNTANSYGPLSLNPVGGNVGIGVGMTNPSTSLQVNGSVTASSFIGDGSGLTNIPSSTFNLAGNGYLLTNLNGNSIVGNLLNTTNKFVGVGTAAPYSTLTALGSYSNPSISNHVYSSITLGSSGSYVLSMSQNASGVPWYFWMQVHHDVANNPGPLVLNPVGGNVGIGVGMTNPTSPLQVNGTITASGFSGNGMGLTNIPVNSFAGGYTTNILIGGHVFFITNGIILNVQ